MYELDEQELKKLHPNIRKLCRWLADEGFYVVGGSEADEEGHMGIVMTVGAQEMVYESDRLYKLLVHRGVVLKPMGDNFYTLEDIAQTEHPAIFSFFDPSTADASASINLLNVTDQSVFGGLAIVP